MKSKTTADLPSLRDLLAAGAHFGHRKEWSKPSARKFTYVVRDGVSVINLEETQAKLAEAGHALEEHASKGAVFLFVGTKAQAAGALAEAAQKVAMPFVADRWLGGTLTNFDVIRGNIQRMADMEQLLANEKEAAKLTKRERGQMQEHINKLHKNLDGIAEMVKLPDMLIVIDPSEEETAVREARRMHIPVMALCDTNVDPSLLDFPIPGNDGAPKTVQIVLDYLTNAIVRGKANIKEKPAASA